ncbi:MAG: SPOR domain-containing protein [Nitrospiraceae bacterium]|nr:SPOR domain-containing protein [Nitrospiraceae bacterium]
MPKNVLVIEKEFDTARQIARALEAEGYFVFTASGAEAGIVMARRVKPSLIFLDLSLKDAGGTEFISRLRAMEFLRKVPILLLTVKDKEYEPRYRDLYGIVNFVKVPLNDAEVIAKSKATLEGIPAETPAGKVVENAISEVSEEAGSFSEEDGIVRLSEDEINEAGDFPPAEPGSEDEEQPDTFSVQPEALGGQPDTFDGQPETHEYTDGSNLPMALLPDETRLSDETPIPEMPPEMSGLEDAGRDAIEEAAPKTDAWPETDAWSEPAGTPVSGAPVPITSVPEAPASGMPASTTPVSMMPGEAGPGVPKEAGFESHIEQAMRRKEGLFGSRQDPPADEGTETSQEKESEAVMKEMKSAEQHKSGKGGSRKSLVYILAIVLAGAAASFVFFMYLAPRQGRAKEEIQAGAGENQPVVIEQNTPAPQKQINAAAPSAAANSVAPANSRKAQQVQGETIASQSTVKNPPSGVIKNKPAGIKNQSAGGVGGLSAAGVKKLVSAKGQKGKKPAAIGKGQNRRSQGFWTLLSKEEKEEAAANGPRQDKRKVENKKAAAGHVYSLQVGAFSEKANAVKLTGSLKAKRFDAFIEQSEKGGKPVYKVQVGKFSRPGDTKSDYERLKKEGFKAFHCSR